MNNSSSVYEIKLFSDSMISFQTEKSYGLPSNVLKPLNTVFLDFVQYTQLQVGQKNGVSYIFMYIMFLFKNLPSHQARLWKIINTKADLSAVGLIPLIMWS